MSRLSVILSNHDKPALFIGNGINRYNNSARNSWDDLLRTLLYESELRLSDDEIREMSNTELFDILDLARPAEGRNSLQAKFCDLMRHWEPAQHHRLIAGWAQRQRRPIITVNFDEVLSAAVTARHQWAGKATTDYYPWNSYFSDTTISDPKSDFAIWHAHGMIRYKRSIRLGLTHYMGAVQRARHVLYGKGGIHEFAKNGETKCPSLGNWLEILFFSPLVIFGFEFNKDETFLRWLFLERARLHHIIPRWKAPVWFIDTQKNKNLHRRPFFKGLGIEYVAVDDYSEIYESRAWYV